MKKMIFMLCLLATIGGLVYARCINLKHHKSAVVVKEGRRIESQEYDCQVRGDDKQYFERKYCKLCGCPRTDHDNT